MKISDFYYRTIINSLEIYLNLGLCCEALWKADNHLFYCWLTEKEIYIYVLFTAKSGKQLNKRTSCFNKSNQTRVLFSWYILRVVQANNYRSNLRWIIVDSVVPFLERILIQSPQYEHNEKFLFINCNFVFLRLGFPLSFKCGISEISSSIKVWIMQNWK